MSDATATQVVQGMILLHHDTRRDRFELWAVKGVRNLKSGAAKVTLLQGTDRLTAEATATFPDGLVTGNWKVFGLSQADLLRVWKGRTA